MANVAFPPNPALGQRYFHADFFTEFVWAGTLWVPMPDSYAVMLKTTDQTLIGTGATKITLNGGLVSSTDGYSLASDILTVPDAGDYFVACSAIFSTFTSGAGTGCRFEVRTGGGGSRLSATWINADALSLAGPSISGPVSVAAGDKTLALFANTSAGTMTCSAGTNMNVRWLVKRLK